jgi:hypothetical protein
MLGRVWSLAPIYAAGEILGRKSQTESACFGRLARRVSIHHYEA